MVWFVPRCFPAFPDSVISGGLIKIEGELPQGNKNQHPGRTAGPPLFCPVDFQYMRGDAEGEVVDALNLLEQVDMD